MRAIASAEAIRTAASGRTAPSWTLTLGGYRSRVIPKIRATKLRGGIITHPASASDRRR
jgi:hypothetical protein